MPISLSNPTSNTWQGVIGKIKSKLQQWGSQWLNPMGRVVLIKSILSTLPIFQCLVMLAPMGIMQQVARDIQKFLWQGGKTNTKKFHLVNWNTVRSLKDNGGLGIKDPMLMNIAMRAKILWHLTSRQLEWWKNVLVKKYFHGNRKWCLDSSLARVKGS
jgi:hypothetical protein